MVYTPFLKGKDSGICGQVYDNPYQMGTQDFLDYAQGYIRGSRIRRDEGLD